MVEFRAADGRPTAEVAHPSRDTARKVGATIRVLYDPADPVDSATHANGHQAGLTRLSLTVFGLCLLGLGGLGFVRLARPRRAR